ncbi:MAG: aminotransferase class V-fold PLP-dependent enzyme [Gammaproteobacteria bacterium]|nr:aminotransferase class V-fold PLP-dependent enzyme [Gammaproteobacteria bacterium]
MTFTRREFIGAASASSALLASASAVNSAITKDDPLGVRADFPAVENTIFFDSAYTSLSPRQAIKAAQQFIAIKAYRPANVPEMIAESVIVRQRFATMIGGRKEEVGLLYATSDGENIVTGSLDLKPGDNVVIDDLHYRSSYVLYQKLKEERGIDVRIVKHTQGAAPVEKFAALVNKRTKLISVSWISHYNGYRHDLKALADLVHAQKGYLYVDAIQGIGILDIDVKLADIDFLASGSYKGLLAGYGLAGFYVREDLMPMIKPDRAGWFQVDKALEDHQFELHTDGRKFQYATLSFDSVYYLNAALNYILYVGVANIEAHTVRLADKLNRGLRAQGFELNTPLSTASSIVSFQHGRSGKEIKQMLEKAGVYISISDKQTYLRVGLALYNNESEIDEFLKLSAGWI